MIMLIENILGLTALEVSRCLFKNAILESLLEKVGIVGARHPRAAEQREESPAAS